ncbi:YeeE/YedE family protein [Psychromonas sp. 14N.309.X.WAT.B.A12]|uniref:YeeE/YedE family protein n=1 Tax=unclassified Psychromonas TaxID=2614957 RepID=UPI0025AF73A9|nr:YeeE/YedE thiosulfate transporter family protein [Psychromonas sp. 14N.309.X.WAT.B.A12]MDN2663579.1 YeeE/YedE thiosulfate transporter family protein [Psychromonas sp. 14N.309.X.WAT.B.A12]
MENFTPWSSLAGGALLGCSAVILLLFSGKVAGISGIFSGLLQPHKKDFLWRLLFIGGMVISFFILSPTLPSSSLITPSIVLYTIAGLLVGIGTKLGNGCTSGHGIIGIARLSKRSIFATCIFISSAIIVVLFR